ncbi:MAG TPA: carbohydrate ABC transporter permease [Clostridiales bacterium]|nr:carbohydrate ABC transporter permease [Clostridiales bacterium]
MAKIGLQKNLKNEGIGSMVFDFTNNIVIFLFCLTIIIPFWYLFVQSVDNLASPSGSIYLWPQQFTLENYKMVIRNKYIGIAYLNTIFRTVAGTTLSLFFTSMGAYAISKKRFPNRVFWSIFIIVTMFFSGGLIPTYLWISKLKLINSRAVLIIPGIIGAYNLVLIRNFFSQIPGELEESARLDGSGDFNTFIKIILPVSKPILATIALWLAVGHWNSWFDCMIYIRDTKKIVLQVVLQRIIIQGTTKEIIEGSEQMLFDAKPEMIKAACIYVATLPILCTYPFLQKYFVKGIYVGSLKG